MQHGSAAKKLECVEGEIIRLHATRPQSGWAAGRLRGGNGDPISFAGACLAEIGARVVLHGVWKNDLRFGRQFSVESFEYRVPNEPEGIAAYISANPAIKGIGEIKAEILVGTFGEHWEHALEHERAAMAKAAHVKHDVIDKLAEEWQRTAAFNQAATRLASYGLTHHQIQTLVAKWGNNVLPMLQADPYVLIREVRGFGFARVDQIARALGTPKDHPSRLRAGVIEVMNLAARDGHTLLPRREMLRRANDLLILDTLDAEERIQNALKLAIDKGELVEAQASATAEIGIALPDFYEAEVLIERIIAAMAEVGSEVSTRAQLAANKGLTSGQAAALEMAGRHRLMILTGGAGTGKTFVINEIVSAYRQAEKAVLLAAPTGKAAKRLEESTGLSASTLHRLLGYDGRGFGFEGFLDTDLVVVDEMSMVDVPLCAELLKRIDIKRTALLLVGDHQQLPPVGAGNVLRDLIDGSKVPVAYLHQVVRQAGALKSNSMAILSGRVAPSEAAPADGSLRPWQVVGSLTDPQEMRDFLTVLYGEVLGDKYGLDLRYDVQVLTPTHKGPLGTRELNVLLQTIVQRRMFGREVPVVVANQRPRLYPGDKIIQVKNNYDLGLMNGAIGIVEAIESNGDVRAAFDGHQVPLSAEAGNTSDVELAYALTVHKLQGSECPVALVICHKSHSFQHHRNLLYTAVTRASRACAILGDHWAIRNCAAKIEVANRLTWLGELAKEAQKQHAVNEEDIPL